MSGLNANRTPGASERSGPPERVLTWHASRAMLPLVGRIAQDIATHHERLAHLRPELGQLERNRRTLDWPKRRRRYQLEDEIKVLDAEQPVPNKAPEVGQHSEDVLKRVLGYDDEKLTALRESGALG